MFRLALRSALAKKRRLFGTALSVLLGVAFLAGTLVFTDTIRRTFDDLFAGIYAATDTYVRSESSVEFDQGGTQRGRIPESTVPVVARVAGVADAEGFVGGYAQITGANGKLIGDPSRGAPTFGMSYVSGALSPWQLTEGSTAPGPGEVVIDKGSADTGHLAIGDRTTIVTQAGPHTFTIVGTARFGSVDSPGGASTAIFELRTAQEMMLGGAREVDAVMARAVPGVSQPELTARVAAVLPKGVEALTGTQITEETQAQMQDALGFFSTFLLVFAAIGLVVACFTIYNTFQIIVTQRTQEMALLRSVGATRAQVLWAQLFEAVIVGITASVVGLAAGVAVAGGLKAIMERFGVDIPAGGTVFETRTAVVALAVGTVVTIASAVFPSLRASRVPPLAAVRELGPAGTALQPRRRLLQGGVLTLSGIGAFVAGLAGSGILWVGIGSLLVFIGMFTLAPLIARPVSWFLGGPIASVSGVTGRLARENAMRNPKRTARTGGALMVGIALIAAITVIAASAKDWTRDVFGNQFTGDFVVSTDTYAMGGLSPTVADGLNRLPEVAAATGVRIGGARVLGPNGGDITYTAVDPATAGKLFDIGMVSGRLSDLTADGILVDDGTARSRNLHVGDQLQLGFLNGGQHTVTVQGVYTDDELAGPFVLSHALHQQTGADQFDFSVYVLAAPGASDSAVRSAIESVTAAYPGANVQSRQEYVNEQAQQLDQLVNLMYALLGLAVIIAVISIANSIGLSIHERTRELGLLRAVGMTRHQTGSAVRWEAVLVSLLGSGLGLLLGVFFGWSISVTVRGAGLAVFSVPVVPLVVILAVGVIGGVIAALRPGWRAAHLDVLRAIAAE
jgi:putative ABC transport system permease protein